MKNYSGGMQREIDDLYRRAQIVVREFYTDAGCFALGITSSASVPG